MKSSIFYNNFEKKIFKGSSKLKNFFQHLKYELRYDILNLDKLVAQTRYPLSNKSKFKSFIAVSPLLFIAVLENTMITRCQKRLWIFGFCCDVNQNLKAWGFLANLLGNRSLLSGLKRSWFVSCYCWISIHFVCLLNFRVRTFSKSAVSFHCSVPCLSGGFVL